MSVSHGKPTRNYGEPAHGSSSKIVTDRNKICKLRKKNFGTIMAAREISDAELALHNTQLSCWIAISGKVYDLTSFLTEHPGGSSIILQQSGKDATEMFKSHHPLSLLDVLPSDAVVGVYSMSSATKSGDANEVIQNVPLSQILNTYDFALNARQRLSKEAWDYLVSAADDEVTYRENEYSFNRIWIRPRVLVDVSGPIDTHATLLGSATSLPVYITATAMGKLYHPDGEAALCLGAGKANVIQMCPTLASCSIEEMAAARRPNQCQWYQLYVNKDDDVNEKLIKKVERLGYKALIITVDVAQLGKRERDQRNKVDDISYIQKSTDSGADKSRGISRSLSSFIDPGLNWSRIAHLRSRTKLPIMLKGIQTAEDAVLAARSGLVDGIIVSNHGGRQVDFARPTVDCLAEIVHALRGEKSVKLNHNFDLYVDGGIRRGTDVFKCLALGAKAVGIGRPSLFALASHGADGVKHLFDILADELRMTMMHTGCLKLSDIRPLHISLERNSSNHPIRRGFGNHESRL